MDKLALLPPMKPSHIVALLLASAVALAPIRTLASESAKVIELWNGPAPGDQGDIALQRRHRQSPWPPDTSIR